ncbi:hypothetical protein PHET_04884 [Paragonimus heterotremus]|uniref:Kinesin-like protein n=1 Tax=Paragonimus heterotremus TaxID=100268 RepID=A0A8J4T189_9TREM|nr:hypothetical protein PHET_04884 [Paragonimus heterotremus]
MCQLRVIGQKGELCCYCLFLRSHDGYRADSDGVLLPDGPTSRYASQQMVFDDLGKGVLDNAFKGYACSLFAYGQTGSGKSYSIMGYGPNRGIVPIICEELFRRIGQNSDKDKKFQVTFSMMEIYNEQIRDLLSKGQSDGKYLQLRQSPDNGFYVQSLTQVPVGSFKEIEQRMDQGTAKRTIAATNMNATSSRAHTMVTLIFDQFQGSENTNGSRKRSVINLIDLAGSERAGLTGATGDRLKEGANINRSLSALGNVISVHSCVVLTKTIMIAAISPADINYHETLSTLRYADRAKRIKNKAIINEDPMEKLIRELKEENERLKKSLQTTELPASVVTKDMSSEEIEKVRRQLREEMTEKMNANLAELEAQNQQTYERKLAQARKEAAEMAIQSLSKEDKTENLSKNKPYLSNLNEDPQLSGVIRHFLVHKTTGIGRKPPTEADAKDQKVHWVTLQGLGLADQHALLIRHGKTGAEVELRVAPGASKMTKVNGVPVKESITLQNRDRILFGRFISRHRVCCDCVLIVVS